MLLNVRLMGVFKRHNSSLVCMVGAYSTPQGGTVGVQALRMRILLYRTRGKGIMGVYSTQQGDTVGVQALWMSPWGVTVMIETPPVSEAGVRRLIHTSCITAQRLSFLQYTYTFCKTAQ